MPLDIDRFIHLRPKLYHLTASSNANRILETGALHSAADLFRQSGLENMIRQRRPDGQWIDCLGDRVHIRDQAPLHAGNIAFQGGWSFERFISQLNGLVFFWPGTAAGPIDYGRRHFQKYANDGALVLELSTRSIFDANPTPGPMFCKYNSGSPRCTGGTGSPRGPETFLGADDYHQTPSSVKEVVFSNTTSLAGCNATTRMLEDFV